jgi:hypothetical protein
LRKIEIILTDEVCEVVEEFAGFFNLTVDEFVQTCIDENITDQLPELRGDVKKLRRLKKHGAI